MTAVREPRLRLHITPTAEWRLRAGHPWLYGDSIVDQNRQGEPGELAVIYDRYDNFLAIGLFDPDSPLRVRILHKGKARSIDGAWWRERLLDCLRKREGLFDEQTTGYRCIHGESDGWPGLVLDRYGSNIVVKLYTGAWLPGLQEIAKIFTQELSPERLVLRLSRNIQAAAHKLFRYEDGQVIYGPPLAGAVQFLESGIRFEADVQRGQKTGFFLDQRENRRTVEALSSGREALNAFSYSGGFSLYAARGGARSVADLDMSLHALAGGRRNFELNKSIPAVAACHREEMQADAFEWLAENARSAPRKFDLVILDPPSLAKRDAERTGAIQAYGKLARHAIDLLNPGGILVAASCSAHVSAAEFFEIARTAARSSGRKYHEMKTTEHPPDHPAAFPEAHYLKCIYLEMG